MICFPYMATEKNYHDTVIKKYLNFFTTKKFILLLKNIPS